LKLWGREESFHQLSRGMQPVVETWSHWAPKGLLPTLSIHAQLKYTYYSVGYSIELMIWAMRSSPVPTAQVWLVLSLEPKEASCSSVCSGGCGMSRVTTFFVIEESLLDLTLNCI
jgi:hypothetical protein